MFAFNLRFNVIRFSSEVLPWKDSLRPTSDDNCQDAVEWVSDFEATGSTRTLNALEVQQEFTTQFFCNILLDLRQKYSRRLSQNTEMITRLFHPFYTTSFFYITLSHILQCCKQIPQLRTVEIKTLF